MKTQQKITQNTKKEKKLKKNLCFRKKHLLDQTTTGLKANLQNIPRYEISYHVVCFAQSEQPKIECIYRLKNTKNVPKTLHTLRKPHCFFNSTHFTWK